MQKRGLVRFKATFMIYLVILLTVYISVVMGQEAQVFGFKDENPTPQTNNPEITNYEDLPSNIRDWLPPNFFNKHINSYNPEGKVLKFQDGRSYSGISGFESIK
ncbi:hypothetical protein HYT58_02590 [Candidatus Woesearchaeota archaeon]|nr:hypothetical protein [Candidatus Woesearchaeota archaeon]